MNSTYFKGQRIQCRGEEWQVEDVAKIEAVNGPTVFEITARGLSNIVNDKTFCFLSDIDEITIMDPKDIEPEIDTSTRGIKAKLYWESCLRRLLPRNGALYLGQHGAHDTLDYQFHPAAKALEMMRPRILIGDAVGLGKTIECGILLSELMRRGKAKRVLCAVPKATLEQFQTEMWARFAIPFHRLDSKGLERLRQDLPSTMNPFFHYDKCIISIDTLKLKKYEKLLQDCDWDVFIVDECHNVADRTKGLGGSSRHKIAKKIADNANSVVLMSATPHDGTKLGFASLVKLLDRTKIKSDTDFTAEDFAEHFIRRSRTDVAAELDQRAKRSQEIVEIPMSDAEVNLLQLLHDGEKLSSYLLKETRRGAKELFKTTLIKSLLSSPQALEATVTKKINKMEKSGAGKPTNEDLENFLNFLRSVQTDVRELGVFSRLQYLKEFITKAPVNETDRIVIFTERIKTLETIVDFLISEKLVDAEFDVKESDDKKQAKGNLIGRALGANSDVDLNRIVKSFQTKKSGLRILVATNVASEGLNLHHNCHRLIHFDLPWSLITLEQRNGRIDRLGQTKQPKIFYLASKAVKDTREVKTKDLKDDFWIIDKIKKRIEIASLDMDEESSMKFGNAEEEEEYNTEVHQGTNESIEQDDWAIMEMISPVIKEANEKAKNYKKKRLPTLFEKSPADFIKEICKQSKIDYEISSDAQTITVQLTNGMEHEVSHWPREFRPSEDAKEITFEASPEKMQDHYTKSRDQGSYLQKTFMNEIHPAIALLENTAQGYFSGNSVPTVTLKGADTDAVYFLVQSTLFNQRNDVVMQYWQVFYHKKGSPNIRPLFDMSENGHANEICEWLNEKLKKMKKKSDLTANESKRIKTLTEKTIDKMVELTGECRQSRGKGLRDQLKAENSRIKDWESERKAFLTGQISDENDKKHKGIFSLHSKATKELESVTKDSKAHNEFIQKYLSSSKDPYVQILGCFIEGE